MSEFSAVSAVTSMLNFSAIELKLSPDLTLYVVLVVTVAASLPLVVVVFVDFVAVLESEELALLDLLSSLLEMTEKLANAKTTNAIGTMTRAAPLACFLAPGRLLTDAGLRRRLLPPRPDPLPRDPPV